MRCFTILILAVAGVTCKAEARLGETYEEIEQRFGKGALIQDTDPLFPSEVASFFARNIGGFNSIDYKFIKDKDGKLGKCTYITYTKYYKKNETTDLTPFTPRDAGELILKNFPNPATQLKISESIGVVGDIAASKTWKIEWVGINGDTASAENKQDQDRETFRVKCCTAEWERFLTKRIMEIKGALDRQKAQKLDAL